CDEQSADLFISTYFSHPQTTPSAIIVHDMIPEVFGYDLSHPMWREKTAAISRATGHITVSENSKRDLLRFFPRIHKDRVTVAPCGVWPMFKPATPQQIAQFRTARNLGERPYFLVVGQRDATKNVAVAFAAFAQFPPRQSYQLVCVGGANQLE